MLLSVFISLLVGVAHAHWWDHKYQWNGQWYDCTSWEDGQWWWRGVSGGGERQGPCQLYSGTGYSYNNGYNYWDPYSVSYRCVTLGRNSCKAASTACSHARTPAVCLSNTLAAGAVTATAIALRSTAGSTVVLPITGGPTSIPGPERGTTAGGMT